MTFEQGELVVYQSEDGQAAVDVHLKDETVWLTLKQIAELFDRDKSVISRHLRNIFQSGELVKEATVAKNATVQKEGNREVTRVNGLPDERNLDYKALVALTLLTASSAPDQKNLVIRLTVNLLSGNDDA